MCEEDGENVNEVSAALQVREENTAGIKLYEKIGFTELRDEKVRGLFSERLDEMRCLAHIQSPLSYIYLF